MAQTRSDPRTRVQICGRLSVAIDGTQVATGSYSGIDVSVSQVQAGGTVVYDLHAHFTGVHASLSELLA